MPEETPLLRGEGIHKRYGERVVTDALRGIDLELEHGAFCALTGPSGSGKTTLLNILGLLDRPSRGRVVLQGRDTGPLGDDERTRIRAESLGFIFQFHHLLMAFTALENVMMPMLSRRGRPRGWIRERAAHLLDRVGLSDRAHYRASDLSGGQQQRVAVARALVMEPALVLADEPTGNLDTESGDVVFEMLRDVARTQGTAFLIVTHDEGIAARCDRIVHMVDGRVASDTATPAS